MSSRPHNAFATLTASLGSHLPQSINVSLRPLPAQAQLQSWWRALEAQADPSFYTTWSWIGSWLSTLPEAVAPQLLLAQRHGERVGMALVVRGRAQLLSCIPVACWHLHATGIKALDEQTIEYNGFLADRRFSAEVTDALLRFLLFNCGVRRLEISQAALHTADATAAVPRGLMLRATPATSHMVDLSKVRGSADGYLPILSANTRSQIRRSLVAYRAQGAVVLEQASNIVQAKAFLASLKALHVQTWQRRGVASGFSGSPLGQRFHDGLIDEAFARGEVQLLRIGVGEADLGYLYNFVHRGRVVFYQSGFRYGLLSKHDRPGLVCHSLAVDHNARAGHALYDFAAGDYRYKTSLSTHCEQQATQVFQRDGVLTRLDDRLRNWKARIKAWRGKGQALSASALAALLASDWHESCTEWLQGMPALA